MSASLFSTRKSVVVAEVTARTRRRREAMRKQSRAEIRCFFTYPFGHRNFKSKCVNCGHSDDFMGGVPWSDDE